jgi:hypothetical protein
MSTAQAEGAYCNARKRRGGRCRLPAGWGTRHVGRGPCRKHLGNAPNVDRHHAHAELIEIVASELGAAGRLDSRATGRAVKTADPLDGTKVAASQEESLPSGRRCRAHSKRSGERCRRSAIPGGTVCVMHGGAAPQVAAAARRRLVYAAATVACARMAALDPQIAAMAGIRSAARPPIDVRATANQLRRARRRQPGWWAAADRHDERLLWREMARIVRERLKAGIADDSAAPVPSLDA